MKDISGLITKAAEKTGFKRDFFKAENIPTDSSNIMVVSFFGDIRSLFILSSIFLHRYKEQDKPSKYIILCSWPGFSSFFPYIDEYWSVQSDLHVKKIYPLASGFTNKSEIIGQYYRNLNQYFFEDLVSLDSEFAPYYNNGLTDLFWHKYKKVKIFLPSVPSSASIGRDFNKEFNERGGYKVLVYPAINITTWDNQVKTTYVPKEFWEALIKKLLRERYVPVICKSIFTHDLSAEFSNSCIYFSEVDMGKVMSVMRMTGCVLDIFTGISRFALAARTPFVCVDERSRYINLKEYEIDDLCGINIPKRYIFSFSTIIDGGNINSWDFDIFNSVIVKLNDFLPLIDKDNLPPTGQRLEFVSYDLVRKKKLQRLGTRLLKLPKDE